MSGYSHDDTGQLVKDIQEGGGRRQEFMLARGSWLELHNGSSTGTVSKRKLEANMRESVSLVQRSGVEVEEVHGYLWPRDLYKSFSGKDLRLRRV